MIAGTGCLLWMTVSLASLWMQVDGSNATKWSRKVSKKDPFACLDPHIEG